MARCWLRRLRAHDLADKSVSLIFLRSLEGETTSSVVSVSWGSASDLVGRQTKVDRNGDLEFRTVQQATEIRECDLDFIIPTTTVRMLRSWNPSMLPAVLKVHKLTQRRIDAGLAPSGDAMCVHCGARDKEVALCFLCGRWLHMECARGILQNVDEHLRPAYVQMLRAAGSEPSALEAEVGAIARSRHAQAYRDKLCDWCLSL